MDEEGKSKKASKDTKKKNKKKKKGEEDDEAFEDSDDGDDEGREVDYMSDESSDSEGELEKVFVDLNMFLFVYVHSLSDIYTAFSCTSLVFT